MPALDSEDVVEMQYAPAALANCGGVGRPVRPSRQRASPWYAHVIIIWVGGGKLGGDDDGEDRREASVCVCVCVFAAYLESKETDTTGSLGQDGVARFEAPALEPVQRVPRRDGRARQRAGLGKVERVRDRDQPLFAEGAELAQAAVQGAAHARGRDRGRGQRAREVALVQERHDPVARPEAGDFGTDGDDFAGAIGAGNDVVFAAEKVFALGGGEECRSVLIMSRKGWGDGEAGDESHTLVTSRSL